MTNKCVWIWKHFSNKIFHRHVSFKKCYLHFSSKKLCLHFRLNDTSSIFYSKTFYVISWILYKKYCWWQFSRGKCRQHFSLGNLLHSSVSFLVSTCHFWVSSSSTVSFLYNFLILLLFSSLFPFISFHFLFHSPIPKRILWWTSTVTVSPIHLKLYEVRNFQKSSQQSLWMWKGLANFQTVLALNLS